jgi:hypothetical protein
LASLENRAHWPVVLRKECIMSTLRAFYRTDFEETRAIWRDGWADRYEEFGREGIYLATRPLDANDGFEGAVVLCLDVPQELFNHFDLTDELQKASGYRIALIPAAALNRLGKPQVYDYSYAGCSRRDLVKSIQAAESADGSNVATYQHANNMCEAMAFLDSIGWLTPLRLKENTAT